MTTCAQCHEEMQSYGNTDPLNILGIFVTPSEFQVGVCTQPQCPNFNLLQRYSDEDA